MATTLTTRNARTLRRCAALVGVAAIGTLALAGCGNDDTTAPKPTAQTSMLAAPNTNIIVQIPPGWHQVLNSSNSAVAEMVAPIKCYGKDEVGCALALARLATVTAKSVDQAADAVRQAVVADDGVTDVADVSKGPGKVGKRDRYLDRFTFKNPDASLTAQVALTPRCFVT